MSDAAHMGQFYSEPPSRASLVNYFSVVKKQTKPNKISEIIRHRNFHHRHKSHSIYYRNNTYTHYKENIKSILDAAQKEDITIRPFNDSLNSFIFPTIMKHSTEESTTDIKSNFSYKQHRLKYGAAHILDTTRNSEFHDATNERRKLLPHHYKSSQYSQSSQRAGDKASVSSKLLEVTPRPTAMSWVALDGVRRQDYHSNFNGKNNKKKFLSREENILYGVSPNPEVVYNRLTLHNGNKLIGRFKTEALSKNILFRRETQNLVEGENEFTSESSRNRNDISNYSILKSMGSVDDKQSIAEYNNVPTDIINDNISYKLHQPRTILFNGMHDTNENYLDMDEIVRPNSIFVGRRRYHYSSISPDSKRLNLLKNTEEEFLQTPRDNNVKVNSHDSAASAVISAADFAKESPFEPNERGNSSLVDIPNSFHSETGVNVADDSPSSFDQSDVSPFDDDAPVSKILYARTDANVVGVHHFHSDSDKPHVSLSENDADNFPPSDSSASVVSSYYSNSDVDKVSPLESDSDVAEYSHSDSKIADISPSMVDVSNASSESKQKTSRDDVHRQQLMALLRLHHLQCIQAALTDGPPPDGG